jgi:hypothetical protein
MNALAGDCTKVTCKAELLEFSFHADDKGLGPTTIDANGNIKLNSGEIRFVNYFAGSDYTYLLRPLPPLRGSGATLIATFNGPSGH